MPECLVLVAVRIRLAGMPGFCSALNAKVVNSASNGERNLRLNRVLSEKAPVAVGDKRTLAVGIFLSRHIALRRGDPSGMKLLTYSDLHLEFASFEPPPTDADAVILAGDISIKSRGVKWANEAFDRPCIYVAGNHEYYDGHLDRTMEKMKAAAAPHVHILENEALVLGNTRFLGTTSWTDFTSSGDHFLAARLAREQMNDYRYIRTEERYRLIRPDDIVARNRAARNWLEEQLSTPFPGKTVVVTHHAPMVAVSGMEAYGHLMAAYANEWRGLVMQANLWVFGHTHMTVDTQVGYARVVSNARGYPGQETGFDPQLVIEI